MKLKATAFGIVAILCIGVSPATSQAPEAGAKKRCKTVVKIVKGHKRKVKVCPKPKPTIPKNVTVSLDSGRGVSKVIAPEGGSITAAAAGGAKFTLSVPASALSSGTTLSVTPVKAIKGLGTAKLLAAVQFEPDGLLLQEPATLTIDLPGSAGSNLEAFGYSGRGQDFTLVPSTRRQGAVELRISHFSGAGVGTNLPTPNVAFLRVDAGTVRILLRQAETGSVGLFERAAQRYSSWKQLVDRLPARQRAQLAADVAELGRSFERALVHFTDEERKLCVDQHDLGELRFVGAMINQLFRAGLLDQDDPLTELATKCARFELTYDGDFRWAFDRADFVIGETHARVEKLVLERGTFVGDSVVFPGAQADLAVTDHRPSGIVVPPGVDCFYTWEGGAARRQRPFVVQKLKINLGTLPVSSATTDAISLSLDPGDYEANDYFNCPSGGVHDAVSDGVYQLGWMLLHPGDLLEGVGYVLDIDWDLLGGELWARKTYDRAQHFSGNPGQFASEKSSFELKHAPQR
jgi:hypothetical protein